FGSLSSLYPVSSMKYRPLATDENEDESEYSTPVKWRMQRRHIVALFAFLGFANIYAMRADLSVAIVQMTTGTKRIKDGSLSNLYGEFSSWSPMVQGAVLGSFFFGYIITQIPGGFLSHRFGGKIVFLVGVFGTTVFTLLTPPFAKLGYVILIIARFVEGMFEGVTYPAMHVMWSHWAPTLEKTKLATFAFAGSYFGTVIAMPLSGYIGHNLGWPFIFYFFGLMGLLWCFFWEKKIADLPTADPDITTDELTLLQRDAISHNTYIVPWRFIVQSKPVWAIIAAHTCQNWGFYTMLTNLPKILEDLASYELEKAGVVSGLPYFIMGATLLWSGQFADYLRKEKGMETVLVRRYFCCGGFVLQAVCLIFASLAKGNTSLLVASLTLSIGGGGFTWAGFSVNHLDIAPQYAGHLMGVSNTVATLPGMISPLIVGSMVAIGSASEWNFIFYVCSGIYLLGAAVYWKWSSGEVESWAADQSPFVREMQ
ncbi:hypothetical protein PFISCL1PPCAC_27237, partial [Pristionchus fissidentatus]